MTRRIAFFRLFSLVGWSASSFVQSLEPVELVAYAVDDSSAYLVYRYYAANHPASAGGISAILLDVSASPGTPSSTLPATGRFINGPAITPLAVAPHAEVGPISPANWLATLRRTAALRWSGATGGVYDNDSIAPGDTLAGLGIRSTFLPGVVSVSSVPTYQACCSEPWGTEEENPTRQHRDKDEFAVTATTVAPRYAPVEITLDIVQSQTSTVCTDPLWIDDSPLCTELIDSLDAADTRLASGDNTGARTALEGVLAILDAQREPTGPIEDNAYWLLRLNTEHVLDSIVGAGDVATGSGTGGALDSVATNSQPRGR